MKPAMKLYSVVVASVVASVTVSSANGAVQCTSSRPGWGDHRTLFVPQWMIDESDGTDASWMEALCCVYTYVEVIGSSSSNVRFELYDGSDYTIRNRESFQEVAKQAMEDICDMQMGSVDCRNQESCVERAFVEPTPNPTTRAPTPNPTTRVPTPSPTTKAPTPAYVAQPQSSPTSTPVLNLTTAESSPQTLNTTLLLMDALNCSSNRPGWADYRTLFIPEDMLMMNATTTIEDTETMVAWLDALCCVYTHVEVVVTPESTTTTTVARGAGNTPQAQLRVYDGYMYAIPGNFFEHVATNAMEDICAMSMRSQDCALQAECVDEAFAATTATNNATTLSGPAGRRAELVMYEHVASATFSSMAPTSSIWGVPLLLLALW